MKIICFANTPVDRGCMILLDRSGCGPKCPFCKSEAELEASKRIAYLRIASLPLIQQRDISKTYYGNKRPWLGVIPKKPNNRSRGRASSSTPKKTACGESKRKSRTNGGVGK